MNPFQWCNNTQETEAFYAYQYWPLSEEDMLEDLPADADEELALVYYQWLSEYCDHDLLKSSTEVLF